MSCKKARDFKFSEFNEAIGRANDSIDELLIGAINKFSEIEFVVVYRYARLCCFKDKEFLPEHQKQIFWKKVADELHYENKIDKDLGVLTVASSDEDYGLNLYIKIKRFMDSFALSIEGWQATIFEGLFRNIVCNMDTVFQNGAYENFIAPKIEERINNFLHATLFDDEYWCAQRLIVGGSEGLNDKDRKFANGVREKVIKNLGALYAELSRK